MITDFKDCTDHGSLLTQPVCKGSNWLPKRFTFCKKYPKNLMKFKKHVLHKRYAKYTSFFLLMHSNFGSRRDTIIKGKKIVH